MRRRDFVQLTTSSLLGVPLLSSTLFSNTDIKGAEEPFKASPALFLTDPYLQKPGAEEMTVRWVTAKPSDSWVEYGTSPELGQKAFASIDGLKTSGRIQAVTLSGLKPGTDYFYRVVSCEIKLHEVDNIERGKPVRSSVKQFTTFKADPASTRFIVVNDIHNQPLLWKSLVDRVADFPYEFAMLNGDIMNHINDEKHLIKDMLRPAGEIFEGRVPFYFVRGNHEARGVFARELKNYLTTDGDRYYYAQTIGPVRLIVLDTGEDKPDERKALLGMADFASYREVQRQWFEREIATPEFQNAKYRLVVQHIPPAVSLLDMRQKWTKNTEIRQSLYEKGGVDLLIAGHMHRYVAHQPSEERSYAIAVGGGPWKGRATVIKVDADQDRLKVTMVRDDGKIVGSFEKKAK